MSTCGRHASLIPVSSGFAVHVEARYYMCQYLTNCIAAEVAELIVTFSETFVAFTHCAPIPPLVMLCLPHFHLFPPQPSALVPIHSSHRHDPCILLTQGPTLLWL